jgi:hypothetical protein
MGIFIMIFFLIACICFLFVLVKTIIYLNITKNYKILLYGLIGSIIEISITFIILKIKGKVETPFLYMIFWYFCILPTIISVILSFIKVSVFKIINNFLIVNISIIFSLFFLIFFYVDKIFKILEISLSY